MASLPFPFLGTQKGALIYEETFSDFSSEFLRASRTEKTNFFLCGIFFPCVVDEMLTEVPLFYETSYFLKNSWLLPYGEYLKSRKIASSHNFHTASTFFCLNVGLTTVGLETSFLHSLSTRC